MPGAGVRAESEQGTFSTLKDQGQANYHNEV